MRHIVFIHIPKTGGNSIVQAFEEALRGRSDLIFHHVGHQNLSYYLEKRALTEAYPRDPMTLYFTVTRNPYTRFVSAYHHNLREEDSVERKMDINALANSLRNHYSHNYWRQNWFVEGRERVHFRSFQLENLGPLVDFFRTQYGLQLTVPIVNAHPHPGPSILNTHSRLVVSLWFGEDFSTFGYDSTDDVGWAGASATGTINLGATQDGLLVLTQPEASNPLVVSHVVQQT